MHIYIGVGIRTSEGAIGYDYVILDDKAAKICYIFTDESENYKEHVIMY